jgi:hypothetical protein
LPFPAEHSGRIVISNRIPLERRSDYTAAAMNCNVALDPQYFFNWGHDFSLAYAAGPHRVLLP